MEGRELLGIRGWRDERGPLVDAQCINRISQSWGVSELNVSSCTWPYFT